MTLFCHMARTAFSILCPKRPIMIGQILVASLWLATIIARLAVASWTATCKQRNINTHKLYPFPLNITSHSDNRKSSKGLFCVLKCARQTNEGTLVHVSWSLTSYLYQIIIARQISDIISIKYRSMFTYPVYKTSSLPAIYIMAFQPLLH